MQMKKQAGYIFRKGDSWFLRYRDTFVENGQLVKRQVARKLAAVEPEHRRLKNPPENVLRLARRFLAPINDGLYQPEKHVTLSDFVEHVYFPNMEGQKRASTMKGYKARWATQLAPRCGDLRVRDFDTPAAQRLLNEIGRADPSLCRSTLHHLKSLLSAIFRHAIQQGYVKGANPIRETSIPRAPEGEETWAYSLSDVMAMLKVLPDPARTIVAVAAFIGLRRSEIRGLLWEHYTGDAVQVMRSVWESVVSEPKTRKSKAPVPVIVPMQRLLDQYRLQMANRTTGVMFGTMKGTPLSLNNVLNRQILPALNVCVHCGNSRNAHGEEEHKFERDGSRPAWHGWHAFRRGLATNLHDLGVDDKTIQAILRHSNVAVTQNSYIKSLPKQSIAAMRQFELLVDVKLLQAGASTD
jgi:integrase